MKDLIATIKTDKKYKMSSNGLCLQFIEDDYGQQKRDISNLRDYFKKWPTFYYFVVAIFSPMWWSGLSQKKFITKYPKKGITLNLGSGPEIIHEKVVNVDMFSYKGVSVLSDILDLPFRNSSIDRVICSMVIEHIKYPQIAVSEIYRILASGGLVYISVPFMYPFHASPNDYSRWTHEGLKELLSDFEILEIGVRAGPFSALSVWLSYTFAQFLSFGVPALYWILMNLFTFIFFPIKILDVFASNLPFAINTAAAFYVVARKK